MESVYLVQRTEYEHIRDEDGTNSVVGVFASLKEANESARSEVDGEAESDQGSDDEAGNDDVPLEITIPFPGDDLPRLEVRVEEHKVHVKPRKIQQVRYGEAMLIPAGLSGGLAGKKFFVSGTFETLTDEAVRAAVYAYGGRAVDSIAEADYFVAGADVPNDVQSAVNKSGSHKIDEAGFFRLVQTGVPANGEKLPTKRARLDGDQ